MESCIVEIIREMYTKIEELKRPFSNYEGNFTYCFRGEGADYGESKLTPTLFRSYLVKERKIDKELLNLISDYNISEPDQLRPLSKAIEGQHFIELSRLLDVTFSILPALFFACSSNEDKDGFVYIFQFPKTYSPSSSYINEYYEKIIENEIIPYYQNFKVLSHIQSNERIKLQSGGFILFPGDRIKPIPESYYRKICIDKSLKKEILEELDNFYNINMSTIYPEKDKKKDLIKKRLSLMKENLKIKNKDSFFYESEIKDALNRIKFELKFLLNENNKEENENNKREVEILRILRKEKLELVNYIADIQIIRLLEVELNQYKENLKNIVLTEIERWEFMIKRSWNLNV